jgi:hypothetical protein
MRPSGEGSGAEDSSVINGIAANDFQRRVLEKLARLETKMDMIVGNGQPGRMKLAEDRLVALERNDLRRTVYDRLITAGISFAISAIIAWRDRLGLK